MVGNDNIDVDKDPICQLIAERSGHVLLQYTILKEDHFPNIQKETIPQIIEGAPNFRQAPGLPVYGVALPTVDGIKDILEQVNAGPSMTDEVERCFCTPALAKGCYV